MGKVFVHNKGICDSTSVGEGTKVWAFAHILEGAELGKNCNICDHVFIENDVVLGDDVTVKCGVQLWDGVRIGNNVFIGPNATFTNDRYPRSKQYPDSFLQTNVGDFASIGANATILPGVKIGSHAMVGAGAVVTKNVPPNAVVTGNPAVISGYQSNQTLYSTMENEQYPDVVGQSKHLGVGNCAIFKLPSYSDARGDLSPVEFETNLPFIPKRSFLVYGVPSKKVRGEHAHHECHQFLVAVHGSLAVVVDDSERRAEVELSDPSIGLYLSPKVWGTQYKFKPETVLLVYASHSYDADDYIRDYDGFIQHKRE